MFRFFGKCRTLPDLKIKSKICFGVVSKNGGKSEDAQEQLLRKLLKQHYSGITVAFFIQCGRKNPDAHSCRHNRHYSAADAAFGRNADAHGKLAGTVIHAAGHEHRIHIACIFIRKQPSPAILMTVLSGLAVFAPKAAPRPYPIVPSPPEVRS